MHTLSVISTIHAVSKSSRCPLNSSLGDGDRQPRDFPGRLLGIYAISSICFLVTLLKFVGIFIGASSSRSIGMSKVNSSVEAFSIFFFMLCKRRSILRWQHEWCSRRVSLQSSARHFFLTGIKSVTGSKCEKQIPNMRRRYLRNSSTLHENEQVNRPDAIEFAILELKCFSLSAEVPPLGRMNIDRRLATECPSVSQGGITRTIPKSGNMS